MVWWRLDGADPGLVACAVSSPAAWSEGLVQREGKQSAGHKSRWAKRLTPSITDSQIYNHVGIDVKQLQIKYTDRVPVNRSDADPALTALDMFKRQGFSLLYPSSRSRFYLENPNAVRLPRNRAPFDVGAGTALWRKLPPSLSTAVLSKLS